jgi:regulator of sigma E protease
VASYAELLARLLEKADAAVTLKVERAGKGAGGVAGPTTTLSIELPPQPRLTTGMVLTPLAIKAVQDDSPAAAAGIRPGERLVSVDGAPVGDPFTLDDRLRGRIGEAVAMTLADASGATRTIDVRPRAVTWRDDETAGIGSPLSIPSLGLAIPVDALVAAVDAGSAADKAGVKAGDRVVQATIVEPGEKPDPKAALEFSEREPNWPIIASLLQQLPTGTALVLKIESDGAAREVTVTPEAAADRFVADRGLVFEPVYTTVKAGSIAGALRRGFQKAGEDLSMVYGFLGKLTRQQISPRLLGGPIEIAKQAGRSASEGFGRLLLFLTMLSANLAVVNFLPIPVLDGGHMVFLAYELVRGKPPSEGVVGVLSYLGLGLILFLMFFVFGLDLGLIPRR